MVSEAWRVSAVAASPALLYAATSRGLVIYERLFLRWREAVGELDGFPGGPVYAMAADPADDTAWLAGSSRWAAYFPLGRRWDGGVLPGAADLVVLDARSPSDGAYFRTRAGWYFVRKGGLGAEPAASVPPPDRRIGPLSARELLALAPALDVARLRIESDELLRSYSMTAATLAPVSSDAYVATNGNGVFKLDLLAYATERLPAGLLSAGAGGLAVADGRVCVGSDVRFERGRRGITCFRDDLSEFTYHEGGGLAGVPGSALRRLALTRRAIWAAGDRGLVRVERRGGEVQQLLTGDGLPSDDVRAVLAVPSGVWIGTTRGLAFAPDTGRRGIAEPRAPTRGAVSALALIGDTVWVGTSGGLDSYVPGLGAAGAGGVAALREPIAAVAAKGDTLLVATDRQLVWRAGGQWRAELPPGPGIGRHTQVAADRDGFWVAGTGGLAYYRPWENLWIALTSEGDVPQPVSDVAADRRYVWAATRVGVVRFERSAIVP